MANNIKLHNLIVTIGPSMCGKSHWASVVQQQLKRDYPDLNVQVVSSDTWREELLGMPGLSKYDNKMWYASAGAFKVLSSYTTALMEWPIAAEVIIVDTTGLGKEFRQQMVDLAKAHAYNTTAVVFNYKDRADYLKFGGGVITQHHIGRMSKIWRDLNIFDNRIEIESPEVDYTIHIPDYNNYKRHFLPDNNYLIIGDVHGQYAALENLPNDRQRVYIGDIVDNAPVDDVTRTIDFVYDDVQNNGAKFIIGNHDYWAVNYWAGKSGYTDDIAAKHFQSALELPDQSRVKLTWLVNNGTYFLRTPNMVITHSPCKDKYLAKLHTATKQMRLRYPRVSDYKDVNEWQTAIYEKFSFLATEDNATKPTHIWGHVALSRPFRNASNIGIDIGAYSGNGLAYYDGMSGKWQVIPSVQTRVNTNLIPALIKPKPKQVLADLDSRQRGRVLWMARNGVNFLSGTMTPADKVGDDLESLQWAFDYYMKHYDSVVIQPKYMGSRGQVYLFDEPEKCYVITKNGYRYGSGSNNSDYDNTLLYPEYARLIDKFKFEFGSTLRLRILDAEIMPWSLFGRGLIDKTFFSYGAIMAAQIDGIDLDMWATLNGLTVTQDGVTVPIGQARKVEIVKQHGHPIWSTYNAYKELVLPKKSDISAFMEQVALYGGNADPQIKPFTILKDVNHDGTERLYNEVNTDSLWAFVNNDPVLHSDNWESVLEFYEWLTKDKQLEGVVLKPPIQQVDGNLPYVKVRNTEYLRLAYGPDYLDPTKYNKLLQRKRIRNKVRASLAEWQSGWQLLQVPYAALAEDNAELIQMYVSHIVDDYGIVDPRL